MKSILEGKKVVLNIERADEIIVVNEDASVWVKHIGNDHYKINKRLK